MRAKQEDALLEDGFYEVPSWHSFRRWRLFAIIAGVLVLGLTIGLVVVGVQLHARQPSSTTEFKPKNLIFFIGGKYDFTVR